VPSNEIGALANGTWKVPDTSEMSLGMKKLHFIGFHRRDLEEN
jgi:hypothetical protein